MGGTPEELPEKYANASPGNFIHDISGQVMIVHGLADSNVGPENTHVAVRELTAAGIPHEVMLFDDEGHGVFRRTQCGGLSGADRGLSGTGVRGCTMNFFVTGPFDDGDAGHRALL